MNPTSAFLLVLLGFLPLHFAKRQNICKRVSVWTGIGCFILGGLVMFGIAEGMTALVNLFHIALPAAKETVNSVSYSYDDLSYVLYLFVTSGFLAPVLEECLCRWGVTSLLEFAEEKAKMEARAAYAINVVGTAALFGCLHLPFGNAVQAVYAGLSGLLLEALYLGRAKSYVIGDQAQKNLTRDLLFHIGFNCTSTALTVMLGIASETIGKA